MKKNLSKLTTRITDKSSRTGGGLAEELFTEQSLESYGIDNSSEGILDNLKEYFIPADEGLDEERIILEAEME